MRISDWSADVCSSDLLGEIAACDLIVGGRIGIPATAAASYRADRLDRDTAQDIVQHRRIAIDGPAIAAIARSFAKLPAPVRHADRIDRPGAPEARFGFADEHGRAALAGVALDFRLGRADGAGGIGSGGLGVRS